MKDYPKVIGVVGLARHGKDTVANYLAKKYGFEIISFATALKEIVQILFGVTLDSHKTKYFPGWNMTYREILQKVGAKMREVHEDVWVRKVTNVILIVKIFGKENRSFVVPDVRYKNEIEAIKELEGKLIKIIRTDYESELSKTEQAHPSETEMNSIPDSKFDLIIKAESGDIDYIHQEIDKFLKGKNK